MKNVARLALVAMFALAFVTVAAAQDAKVAGKWETTVETPNGTRTTTFTFEVNGDKLTGTVAGGRGGDAPLSGTVKGKEVAFTVKRMMRDQEITIEYKGTVEGDEIKGTVGTPQGSRDWLAKRVK